MPPTVPFEKRIKGPLESCREEAEAYYRNTLKRLDFSKGKQVKTKYGQTWTYKFGPDDKNAPKILFIHGINTSCLSLADIAKPLSRDCQVLLYDLYGRGLSDGTTVDKHNEKLYVGQAKEVLDSYGWKENVIVVGYSMGGSIAVHLNNTYAELIDHLFLLGPAGLIRRETFGESRISLFGYPDTVVQRWLVSGNIKGRNQKLYNNLNPKEKRLLEDSHAKVDAGVLSSLRSKCSALIVGQKPVIKEGSTLEEVVCYSSEWFERNHKGYLRAISESIGDAPLHSQNKVWDELKKRKGDKTTTVILGTKDDKIIIDEFKADFAGIEKDGNMRVETLDGAPHHFPMTHPEQTRAIIRDVLKMGAEPK